MKIMNEAWQQFYEFDYYALQAADGARDYDYLREQADLRLIAKLYLKNRLK